MGYRELSLAQDATRTKCPTGRGGAVMIQKLLAAVVGVVVAGMATAGPSMAVPMIYQYQGNNFETFSGIYDDSMSVSGSFTFAEALAPNLSDVNITFDARLLSFSFTDSVDTITSDNTTEYQFFISTDSFGNIEDWRFDSQKFNRDNPALLNNVMIITCLNMKQICGDFASTGSSGFFEDLGVATVSEANTGIWSVTPVPLPATLPLYGTGLGLMALFGWWRKRRAAAA